MTTLSAALKSASETLTQAGIEAAMGDARRLLAHALGVDPGRLSVMLADPLPEDTAAAFDLMVRARADRTPVSHILGYRDFWRHRFKVTPDVLDPRPETETLVALALSEPFTRVLDLGTGSGCILISLLLERPEAKGVGTDVSETAVLIAGENAAQHRVADRLVLPLSTWLDDVGGQYDLIVSNPPYIAVDEIDCLQPEVRNHEPRIALTDEADGLTAYRAIAFGAGAHLMPGGRVLVEIGPTQGLQVKALFTEAGFCNIAIHPDLDGRDRVVLARWPGANCAQLPAN